MNQVCLRRRRIGVCVSQLNQRRRIGVCESHTGIVWQLRCHIKLLTQGSLLPVYPIFYPFLAALEMVLSLSFPRTYFPNFNFFSFQDLSHKALHPSAPLQYLPFGNYFHSTRDHQYNHNSDNDN